MDESQISMAVPNGSAVKESNVVIELRRLMEEVKSTIVQCDL